MAREAVKQRRGEAFHVAVGDVIVQGPHRLNEVFVGDLLQRLVLELVEQVLKLDECLREGGLRDERRACKRQDEVLRDSRAELDALGLGERFDSPRDERLGVGCGECQTVSANSRVADLQLADGHGQLLLGSIVPERNDHSHHLEYLFYTHFAKNSGLDFEADLW